MNELSLKQRSPQDQRNEKSSEEDNSPTKIFSIRKVNAKSIYELKTEELRKWLRPINDYELAVIPIVGPSRLGKSFLLNYMCRFLANPGKTDWLGKKTTPLKGGFHWKCETVPQTDGIWISKPYILEKSDGKKIAVILLDTQGVFDQHTNKRDWSTIVGISLLISSCLIFNIAQNLQEDALIFLEAFLEYGLKASKSFPNLKKEKPFQNMLFLIRDWGVASKHKYGFLGGNDYLESKLEIEVTQQESAQNSRKILKECFSEVNCYLLPKLGDTSDEPDFDGRVGQLSQDFSRKLKELIFGILNPDEIKVKKINDKTITGAEFCQLMEGFVKVFNSSEFDEPSSKDLLNAYSRISDKINLRRNKDLHLSMLENMIRSKPFLARNILVESCHRINEDIIKIFDEEMITNNTEFIEEMEGSFEDNFNKVYTQNEIKRKDFITKAIEECKQLFIQLSQNESENTKTLNLLDYEKCLKNWEKIVCEKFKSYYMGEEENLFLKDFVDLTEFINKSKEELRQIQSKHLNDAEDLKTKLVEQCLQIYSTGLQNLLDTNVFIDPKRFKEIEVKVSSDTIETFKENFKFENSKTNQFYLLDLEKNIKEKKKQFKIINESKYQQTIESTEELLRKSVAEYDKNMSQWIGFDTIQDLKSRQQFVKNDSIELFVKNCVFREEGFITPFLHRLNNEIDKIYSNFESKVNSKISIYENAFQLSIDNYVSRMKHILEKNIFPEENQLERENKSWKKEAQSLYEENLKISNPSENLYFRYQYKLSTEMDKEFDRFVSQLQESKKQIDFKINEISQKLLTKFNKKMENFIQIVRNNDDLNFKLREVKDEILNDFEEKLEFLEEIQIESNKNDLDKLMDIHFDKIINKLESRNEELRKSFESGVIQYLDKYVQKMDRFCESKDLYNEMIFNTFHQNLMLELLTNFKANYKSILNIEVEEYESKLKKSIENNFNSFIKRRDDKINKIYESIKELTNIYLNKMESQLKLNQSQEQLKKHHLVNKKQVSEEFCRRTQSVAQHFLLQCMQKLEEEINESYDQFLAKFLQKEENFKQIFDDKVTELTKIYYEEFNLYFDNGQIYENNDLNNKDLQIKRKLISNFDKFARIQSNSNVDTKIYIDRLEDAFNEKFQLFMSKNNQNRLSSVEGLQEESQQISDKYNSEMNAIYDSIINETELNEKHNSIKNRVISEIDKRRFKDESAVEAFKDNLNQVLDQSLLQFKNKIRTKFCELYKLELNHLKDTYNEKMDYFFNKEEIISDENLKEKHDQISKNLSQEFRNKQEHQFDFDVYLNKLSDILSDNFKEYQNKNHSRNAKELNKIIDEFTEQYMVAMNNNVCDIEDQKELESRHLELKNDSLNVFEAIALTQHKKEEKNDFLNQLGDKIDENFKKTLNTKKPIIENLKLKVSLFYEGEMNKHLEKEVFINDDVLIQLSQKTTNMVRAKFENEFKTLDREIFLKVLEKSVRLVFEKIYEKNHLFRPKSTHAIGIDLGTTNSCVSYFKPDANNKCNVMIIPNEFGRTTTASVVSIRDDEEVVGDAAKEETYAFPRNTIISAKRLIGRKFKNDDVQNNLSKWYYEVIDDGDDNPQIRLQVNREEKRFYAEQISAKVLKKLKDIAQKHLGCDVIKAVITVPAYFNEAQKEATKDAGKMAGLDVMRIINEPTAAAIAYRLNWTVNSRPRNVLIYDFGGGTFDVAVLIISKGEIDVRAVGGDNNLGGDDFDTNLIDYCMNEFSRKNQLEMFGDDKERAVSRLRLECEKCKIKLTGVEKTKITIRNFYENHNLDIEMSRKKFEEINESLIKRSMDLVLKTLTEASMTTSDIDDIVLVGGSTRIPKIQEDLQDLFDGKPLNYSVNPDEAVAVGAAIQAALLNEKQSVPLGELVLSDVTPLSLGIRVKGGKFSKIISKNTKVPTTRTENYSTAVDDQESVEIKIYEGEDEMATKNNLLGTFNLREIPRAKKGVPSIPVTFHVTSEGILSVKAKVEGTGEEKDITITEHRGRPKIN